MHHPVDEASLLQLERLIAVRTGLQLRPHEREALRGTLAERIIALHLPGAGEYNQLLQADTPASKNEWEQLSTHLTNNESYFFRDKGQIALLRERILPELIANNQARRTLRLWSAGCSTGEEPYSLALLVNELLPQRGAAAAARWNIVILGTDIDGQALQQARRGLYGSWSFRTVDPMLQQRYFHRQENGWQIAEASRSLVTFHRCNLVGEPFPSTALGIYDMDLILCRNVFIYFERDAISAVLRKFTQTLREGGYLMTGHGEVHSGLPGTLQARVFPESVVYQRTDTASANVVPDGLPRLPGTAAAGHGIPARSSPPPSEASKLRPMSAKSQAIPATPPAPPLERTSVPSAAGSDSDEGTALLRQAQTHANLGHYEEATHCCERLLKARPFAPEPYELLASIAQEQGRKEEAKEFLKKALYLAPTSPSAYLELGAIYHSEGDTARARKMHSTALELLQQSPPSTPVGLYGTATAQEWMRHVRQLLAEGE